MTMERRHTMGINVPIAWAGELAMGGHDSCKMTCFLSVDSQLQTEGYIVHVAVRFWTSTHTYPCDARMTLTHTLPHTQRDNKGNHKIFLTASMRPALASTIGGGVHLRHATAPETIRPAIILGLGSTEAQAAFAQRSALDAGGFQLVLRKPFPTGEEHKRHVGLVRQARKAAALQRTTSFSASSPASPMDVNEVSLTVSRDSLSLLHSF